MTKWTQEFKDKVAELLPIPGMSSAKIASELGVTKNVIIGIVRRNPELKAIGLQGVSGSYDRSNVVRLPVSHKANRNVEPPKLVTNKKMLIADYLAKHGARRFARGETVDYTTMQLWLAPRGYTLQVHRSKYLLTIGTGKPKPIKWHDVIRFVDRLRIAEGLQPILRAS